MGQTAGNSRDSNLSRQVGKLAVLSGAFLFVLLAALAPAPAVRAADDLPDGAGKDVVLKVCTACHGVSEFTARRNTRAEWDEEVDKMAARGAKASDEEFEAIVNYLTKNFFIDTPAAAEKTN